MRVTTAWAAASLATASIAVFAAGCQGSIIVEEFSPQVSGGSGALGAGVSAPIGSGGGGAGGVAGQGGGAPVGGAAGTGGVPAEEPAACVPGQLSCFGVCTATATDNAHCGACGNACSSGQSCTSGSCACTTGGVDCGAGCVDTQVDAANCGTCGNACTSGQACQAGACQCLGGLAACGGECVDLNSNAANCGTCGNACAQGYVCSNGACSLDCAGGLTQCGQECVDLTSSGSHCGACEQACPAAQSCAGGQCACTGGQALCGGQCVSTSTSNSHCGGCDNACSGGQSCSGGQCVCPSGSQSCGGQCVNTSTSSSHCGGCNKACSGGQSCSAGQCVCPSGQTLCNGQCVDTATSTSHCGACNKACATGATCSSGTCSGGSTGGQTFGQCRFHFGTTDSKAKASAALIQQLDYFIPGWLGQADTFDMTYVCNDTKASGPLANLVPAVVAYVIAFKARRDAGLQDCNVSGNTNLCRYGATFIRNNRAAILNVYKSYAQGFAGCYGTTKPMIWMMEPDFYQYHAGGDAQALTRAEAGQLMAELVAAVRQHMPNAVFSMDISPWVSPNNGRDNGADWFSNFKMSDFTFINTSGGGTHANNVRIRPENEMTWAGVHMVTGKPILADTGYGVAGTPTGHDANWDNVGNVNARIANGVAGIAQYNPNGNWATTISQIRSQLDSVGCY